MDDASYMCMITKSLNPCEYALGECIALRSKPNEPSIQHHVYIIMQLCR